MSVQQPIEMSQSSLAGEKSGGPLKGSPWKKSPPKKASSRMNKSVQCILTGACAFDGAPMELHSFERTTNDGRVEAHTKAFRDAVDSNAPADDIPHLSEAGFCAHYTQRRSVSQNLTKTGADGWARFWIVRVVPGSAPSTEATRQQGLDTLAAFFMDRKCSRHPPSSIVRVDATGVHDLTALDHFFLDRDVISAMSLLFEEDELNAGFSNKFSDVAHLFFSGPIYPQLAADTLGCGVVGRIVNIDGDAAAVAPGMVLPDESATGDARNALVDTEDEADDVIEDPPNVRRSEQPPSE